MVTSPEHLSIKTGWMYVVIELPTDYQNEVTTVICRKIRPGHEKDYNDWIRSYLTLERKAPGYRGTTIIIPGGSKSPLRYIIRRFADKAAMEGWDNSEESLRLLKEANDYSTRYYGTSTGLETWFTLPGLKTLSQSPPSKWKMAIVFFFAAYAISSLSRSILNPLIGQWPILGNAVIYTAILVVLLTYFALPIVNRLLRHWLYPGSV
jgi:antibiotic biosynthesis monooxygenase (ABM) superfamily enzyme